MRMVLPLGFALISAIFNSLCFKILHKKEPIRFGPNLVDKTLEVLLANKIKRFPTIITSISYLFHALTILPLNIDVTSSVSNLTFYL